MAETIGRAYIKILADGSGMPESIRDEVRKSEPTLKKEARRQGDAYADEFKKRMSQKDIGKDIRENLERSMARTDIARAYFGSRDWDRFLGRLKKEAGNAGVLAGHELEVEFRHNIEGLADAVGDIGPRFDAAAKRLAEGAQEASAEFGNLANAVSTAAGAEDEYVRSGDDVDETNRRHQQSFSSLRKKLDDFAEAADKVGVKVGKAFGKGSRNDAINFFGAMVGGLASLPGKLASAASGIGGFVGDLRAAFKGSEGGMEAFVATVGQIGPKIFGAIAIVPAAVIGFGSLTTALLLTAGAAAALVATIGFGLVGAVAPLVGLLGPLGLVAGGLAVSFIKMSDAAKQSFKDAFAPLKSELQGLGDAARPGILDGITQAAKNLEEPMSRLQPLFKVIGDSIGNFIDIVSKISFGPEFTAFVNTMTKTLPSTMKGLGTIVGNTLDGLFGLFATLQPVTDTFLGSLERITGAFASWSVSKEATNFFAGAADSASALLDFLGPVWSLVSEILNAGKSTGDSLFRSMGQNIQQWVDALRANPDILKNFFKDAKRMGQALGDVIESFGHLIDALDTPVTRDWAVGIIKGASDLINVVADLLDLLGKLPGSFQAIIIASGLGLAAFTKLSGGILSVATNLKDSATRVETAKNAWKAAAGVGGIGGLAVALQDAAQHGTDFGNVMGGIVSGAALGSLAGPIGALIGGAAGGGLVALAGAFDDSKTAAQKLRDEVGKPLVAKIDSSAVQNLLTLLAKAHGNYRLIAQDAAGQAVEQAAGGLEKLMQAVSATGLRKDTIASAFAGDPEAIKRVTDAMGGLNEKMQVGGDVIGTFSDAVTETNFAHLVGGADQAQKEITDLNTAYESGLIGAKQLAEGTQLLNDALADGTISGKEYGDILDFNRGITEQLTTNVNAQKDALQTLTNITGDAAKAQSILNQNNKEGADLLGITVDQLQKLPKKVQTDIGLNGAPETTRQALKLIGEFGKLVDFKDIKTIVSAPGVDLTRKQIETLAQKAKLTPKQIKILLKTEGAGKAGKDVDGVRKKAEDIGKKKHDAKLGADTSDFDTQLSHIKAKMSNIPKTSAKAKFDADTSKFDNKNREVKDKLNTANNTTVTPKITVDNSAAMTGINNTHTALNNIPKDVYSTIHVNTVRTGGGKVTAMGGIFAGAQTRLIGEAGPEAVVPLSRPLSQVDPAVRALSAIAQGMRVGAQQRPVAQKTIDVGGIQIITPTRDPGAVAQEMVNRLVAVGY